MYYHGTNANIKASDLLPDYGRFGEAVYLTSCPKEASTWGKNVLEVNIEHPHITINYRWLSRFDKELSIEEEEGLTNLREFVDYPFVEVKYEDGTSEFILYDVSLLEK